MRAPGRWALSPAYDLNPVPEIDRAQTPKTAITEQREAPTIAAAIAAAPRFGLKPREAKAILAEVFAAVRDWRSVGRKLRLRAVTLDACASAFEQPLMDEARRTTGR
jgi:serine/threonine-protein kinase HipA